jgi:protein tyrosine/serine phosphatase
MSLPTDPDCYWVEPGLLLAGEYPGAWDEATARTKLGALLACGIRTFIDLTESREHLEPYESLLISEAEGRAIAVEYHRLPIRDVSIPSALRMREILTTITASTMRGDPVYVHCWGGIGRTGTVVGCWLIEAGQASGDALAAIATLRTGIKKCGTPSPETAEQSAYVRDWPVPTSR